MLDHRVTGQGNNVKAGKSRILRVWALDWLVFILKACSKEREREMNVYSESKYIILKGIEEKCPFVTKESNFSVAGRSWALGTPLTLALSEAPTGEGDVVKDFICEELRSSGSKVPCPLAQP